MSYRERAPHPALGPFVDRFWISGPEAPALRRILPDGCLDLIVNLREGRAVVVGAMTTAVIVQPRPGTEVAAVRFRPGGAFPFLRLPVVELTDRMVDAAALGLPWAQSLASADGPAEAMTLLERSLLARLPSLDRLTDHAVRALMNQAPPSIETLARKIGWTRQHLARVLRQRVGLAPKQLARVARLQRATLHLQKRQRTLADAAAMLGYCDEAHMALDFRLLAGVTPATAAAERSSIFPIPSLYQVA